MFVCSFSYLFRQFLGILCMYELQYDIGAYFHLVDGSKKQKERLNKQYTNGIYRVFFTQIA